MFSFDDLDFRRWRAPTHMIQAHWQFANGYGLSVIRGQLSNGGREGLYELAVLGPDGMPCYDTPVTDDVLGYLTPAQVTEYGRQVEALPVRSI